MHQLDIFLDTRATSLANALIAALLDLDGARAGAALEELHMEAPDHASLPALGILCRFVEETQCDGLPIADALAQMEAQIVPASAALGERAEEFLRPFWRRLARQAATAAYDPACPEAHAAALWLRAGDHAQADSVADHVAGGENLADVLRWRCLARHRFGGLDAALPQVMRFAWFAPARLAALVAELRDPLLERAWRGFQADLGDLDASWFPAWFLHEHRGAELPPQAAPEHVPAAQAHAVLVRLLDLEKRGYGPALVSQRARLRSLGKTFFEFYLARRSAPVRPTPPAGGKRR
ncbi:MAG: hypothetical protein HY778_14190 [Betaproteobacteria bacterium]|nr:hypothetical protein [Betaproteobacteria bacterium]